MAKRRDEHRVAPDQSRVGGEHQIGQALHRLHQAHVHAKLTEQLVQRLPLRARLLDVTWDVGFIHGLISYSIP